MAGFLFAGFFLAAFLAAGFVDVAAIVIRDVGSGSDGIRVLPPFADSGHPRGRPRGSSSRGFFARPGRDDDPDDLPASLGHIGATRAIHDCRTTSTSSSAGTRCLCSVAPMPQLLIVHHTASPATHELLGAVRSGASAPEIDGVEVVVKAALEASASDVLAADGYLLGTPANLGYMSGALKHFFDTVYYPCLESTTGRPFGAWIYGNNDTGGAAAAIEKITTGLGWRKAQPILEIMTAPDANTREQAWELGATVAALLSGALS